MPSIKTPQLPGSPNNALEQRLAKLESVIKISNDGSVTIECNNKITIKAGTSVDIEGATTVRVKGASNVEVNAAATLTLKGGAMANLQAGIVKLNNGAKPLIRMGDMVMNPVGPPGVLTGGNMTVLG
jgi:hypothetical protein